MPALRRNPIALSESNRAVLENWTREFDRTWEDGRLAAWVRQLPPSESPLRLAGLFELVKIDLRRHWSERKPRQLEIYLKDFPELASSKEVLLSLVQQEYEARVESGQPGNLPELAQRFPRLAVELASRIEAVEAAMQQATLPPPATTQPHGAPMGFAGELPEQFGRYRIIRRLGQGGMGSVYLAQDTHLDRRVALKIPHFRSEDGSEALSRFHREARSAALLHHPNLCPVYDVGELNGTHFLTMAFIEGKPLSEFVAAERRLAPRQVALIARKMAIGLAEAHANGIIHRDLKPSNVILTAKGEPIVMDFGLARRTDPGDARLTRMGALIGTPAYMSPEQVNGEDSVGPPSDIYSLGVILYELLTSKLPFEGNPAFLMALILTQDPPPPLARRGDLDPALDVIVRRAMAKRRENRFARMEDLAEALEQYLKTPEAGAAPKPRATEKPKISGPIPIAKLVPGPPMEAPAAVPVVEVVPTRKTDSPPRKEDAFTAIPIVTAVAVGGNMVTPPPLPTHLPRSRRKSGMLRLVLLGLAAAVACIILAVLGYVFMLALSGPVTPSTPTNAVKK